MRPDQARAAVLARYFAANGTLCVSFPGGGRPLPTGSAHGPLGEPPTKSARERTVAVRIKQPAKMFHTTPENVGKEKASIRPGWRSSGMSTRAASSVRSAT